MGVVPITFNCRSGSVVQRIFQEVEADSLLHFG